jgi:hypothetical protein
VRVIATTPPTISSLTASGTLGRWAFAAPTEIYQIDAAFNAKVEREFDTVTVRVIHTTGLQTLGCS